MFHAPYRRLLPRTLRVAGAAVLALAGIAFPAGLRAQDAATTPAEDQKPAISARQSRAADDAYLEGARQLAHNDPVAAEQSFGRALALDPSKQVYALSLAVAKEHQVTALVQQGAKERLLGHTEEANKLFAEADKLDPNNAIVTQHLDQGAPAEDAAPGLTTASDAIAKLGGPIHLKPTPDNRSFHSRGDIQQVFREVYSAFGIKPSFDPSITNQSIRFDLEDVDFATATRVLLYMTHTFATPLNPDSVLIAKDTQENRDRLVPQVEETFYLPGLPTEQLTELSNVAKNIFDLKQVAVQASGNRIVMRGREDAMNLVNVTFAGLIDSTAEIMIEVHIYELDKTHMRNIGAQLPSSASAFSIAAEAQSLVSANQALIDQAVSSGLLVLNGTVLQNIIKEAAFVVLSGAANTSQFTSLLGVFGGGLTFAGLSLGGSSTFNLLLSSSDVRSIDDVELRLGDNQSGSFRAGTRYPIVTSTYSSGVSSTLSSALSGIKVGGTSAAALLAQLTSSQSATVPQVQYEDLGLTLKATPTALKSGQVHVKLDMKIEALGGASLNGIPVLNNRTLTSDVTIPADGTVLMASEVTRSEQHAIDGLPGLSEIPGFQGTDKTAETDTAELLITLTPHIVRKRSSMVASRRLVANVSTVEQ
ncbi:MAG TPA: type II secretory protein PulD [Acidobacteriaceae bacterium]